MNSKWFSVVAIKVNRSLRQGAYVDIGVFFSFLSLFILLNWRLFAFGSEDQLFLYGDNLPILNNLFYLFNNFNIFHPFNTLIGQNGMLGSYPMAEPQSSIFYPPITFLFVVYKLFHLQVVGLYYELLFLHTAHFLLGVFFIYKICHKILRFSRPESFFAGLVYLGLGWNAAWFGTGALSYMIGLLPLLMYTFLMYLQKLNVRWYAIFVLSMTLFLYAGGLVNFFFYLLSNFFVLLTSFVYFKYDRFFTYSSKKECVMQYGLIFLLAPVLSLLAYSIQLFITYNISSDVSHATSSYDYLAFFGLHFHDLIGVLFPKFALVRFGSVSNPQVIIDFLIANSMYVGFITVIAVLFGMLSMKSKELILFVCMLLLNLLLAFGGAFVLYDATYVFPGNNLFRGHYKYLMFVGMYVALIMPFVLHAIQQKEYSVSAYKKIQKYITAYLCAILVFAMISGVFAFVFKFLQRADTSFPVAYSVIALTLSSYFFRMLLIGVVSGFAVRLFVIHEAKRMAMVFLALVLVVDISVNFKYNMYYSTSIQDLTSKSFFQCCQNKTIASDIGKYTQAYHIPEVVGVDLFTYYSAIPNQYLTDYSNHLQNSIGGFNSDIMRAAGIDGVLTMNVIESNDFTLIDSKEITRKNYEKFFEYNADGDIHNDWGTNPTLIGQIVRYYALHGSKKAYFTTEYDEKLETKSDDKDVWDAMIKKGSIATVPVLLVDQKEKDKQEPQEYAQHEVTFLVNEPSYKKIALNNEVDKGLFYVNIPYSSIWTAKVNGIDAKIYRANDAFSAVKIADKNSIVELYVDTKWYSVFMGISALLVLLLVSLFCIPIVYFERAWKKLYHPKKL